MRSTFVVAFFVLILSAAPAFAGPVNPVANGDFKLFAPFGAAALRGTPAEGPGVGVGREVLGCTRSANIIWEETCTGAPSDRATEVNAIAADPQSEIDTWTAPGLRNGDLPVIAPSEQGVLYAASWIQYPSQSIAFGDQDGNGDREAKILPGNQMLYQSFASPTHTLIPAGLITAVTVDLEAGTPSGSLVFVLDSFPAESAADWPQAFINYQLSMPAGTWNFTNGVVTIDPLKGSLSGPAAGGWLVEVDDHPTAAQWAGASREERTAILMELRVTQFTFWNLRAGTVVDNVAFDIGA